MSAKPETPATPIERLVHDSRTVLLNLDAVRLNSHRADRQIDRSTALENGSARRYDVTTTSPAASSVGRAGLFGGPCFLWAANENHRLLPESVVKDFFTTAADGEQYRPRHYAQ